MLEFEETGTPIEGDLVLLQIPKAQFSPDGHGLLRSQLLPDPVAQLRVGKFRRCNSDPLGNSHWLYMNQSRQSGKFQRCMFGRLGSQSWYCKCQLRPGMFRTHRSGQ
ncbi:hypothetical protein V2G26_014979 [Clonostachys chloroleuca]